MHTNKPYNKLLYILNEPVDFCFKAQKDELVDIESSFKYLIDNSYFKFEKKLFRRVIGKPMRSNPAPFMAKISLYIMRIIES